MSIGDFSECLKVVLSGSYDVLDDKTIEKFHICYARSNGNTVGCPTKAFREEMQIEGCLMKCSECWNVCLNHVFDRESLGGFWKI